MIGCSVLFRPERLLCHALPTWGRHSARHAFIGEDGRRRKSHVGTMLSSLLRCGITNPLAVGGNPHRSAAASSAGEPCKCAMSFVGNTFLGNALSETNDFGMFRECECP